MAEEQKVPLFGEEGAIAYDHEAGELYLETNDRSICIAVWLPQKLLHKLLKNDNVHETKIQRFEVDDE